MRLICGGATEKGPVKAVNQDSYLVKRAETPAGDVALAVVADGMSGLDEGEVASAAVVRAFDQWFQRTLPCLGESLGFAGPSFAQTLHVQWENVVQEVNLTLMQRGLRQGASLGAACTIFLVAAGIFYVMQVGDTRLYCVSGGTWRQLTEDQTFAAREQAAGRLSPQELAVHPLRNTLLQCVGASQNLNPVFFQGVFDEEATYLVCSDGFHRSVTELEVVAACAPAALRAGGAVHESLQHLLAVGFTRGQKDNATAVALVAAAGEGLASC